MRAEHIVDHLLENDDPKDFIMNEFPLVIDDNDSDVGAINANEKMMWANDVMNGVEGIVVYSFVWSQRSKDKTRQIATDQVMALRPRYKHAYAGLNDRGFFLNIFLPGLRPIDVAERKDAMRVLSGAHYRAVNAIADNWNAS